VLNGLPPANTFPVIIDLFPGMQFRYSGGGTTIAQAAVTDILGLPFPELMRELIFDPLALNNITALSHSLCRPTWRVEAQQRILGTEYRCPAVSTSTPKWQQPASGQRLATLPASAVSFSGSSRGKAHR
jgi:CubicO group peptidase (beta-lactamase class C family)